MAKSLTCSRINTRINNTFHSLLFPLIRMMAMFEDIVSLPVFLQVPMFGVRLAVLIYQLESVRSYTPLLAMTKHKFPSLTKHQQQQQNSHIFNAIIAQNIINFSLIHVILILGTVFYAALEIYAVCYFISSITIKSVSIADIAYNSSWYQMPRADRICVEMIMRRAQRPYELKGLGIFVCSLETYLMVRWKKNRFFCVCSKNRAFFRL